MTKNKMVRTGRVTLAEKIEDLPIINEVDEMILEGVSTTDIAKYIQNTFELLTEVTPNSLRIALDKRKVKLDIFS